MASDGGRSRAATKEQMTCAHACRSPHEHALSMLLLRSFSLCMAIVHSMFNDSLQQLLFLDLLVAPLVTRQLPASRLQQHWHACSWQAMQRQEGSSRKVLPHVS